MPAAEDGNLRSEDCLSERSVRFPDIPAEPACQDTKTKRTLAFGKIRLGNGLKNIDSKNTQLLKPLDVRQSLEGHFQVCTFYLPISDNRIASTKFCERIARAAFSQDFTFPGVSHA